MKIYAGEWRKMSSLLEQLPKIVADGKREAEQILERIAPSSSVREDLMAA